jgi:hypothetical protein
MKKAYSLFLAVVLALSITPLVFGAGFFEQGTAPPGGYPSSPSFVHWGTVSGTATDNIVSPKGYFSSILQLGGFSVYTINDNASIAAGVGPLLDNSTLAGKVDAHHGETFLKRPRVDVREDGANPANSSAQNNAAFAASFLKINTTYPPTANKLVDIYVPAGVYEISESRTWEGTGSHFLLHGDGKSTRIKWVGADNAVMFRLGKAEYGGISLTNSTVEIRDITFDMNNKASSAVSIGSMKQVRVVNSGFYDPLDNTTKIGGLDIDTANYGVVVQSNWFSSESGPCITINRNDLISGPVGVTVENNYFNLAGSGRMIYAKNVDHLSIKNNTTDGLYAATNSGMYLDKISQAEIVGNYAEQLSGVWLSLNPTSAPAGSPTINASILRNTVNTSGHGGDNQVVLGYTKDVEIRGNSFINVLDRPIWITSNAVGTRIGRNYEISGGNEVNIKEQFTDNGVGTLLLQAHIPIIPTAALVLLDNQSEIQWADSPTISSTVTQVPADATGYMVWVRIQSVTAGARLYVVGENEQPTWATRNSSIKVQWIEAVTANKDYIATFFVPANKDYPNLLVYGIGSGGTTDTDIEIRVIGYTAMI